MLVLKVINNFFICSTVGLATSKDTSEDNSIKKSESKDLEDGPSPRFGTQLAIDKGVLYLFGGMVEDENDRQLTHKDFYALGMCISYNIYYLPILG